MSRSTRLICTSEASTNSSDACSRALGSRLAKPGRCRTSRAVRVAREPSTGRNYVALTTQRLETPPSPKAAVNT